LSYNRTTIQANIIKKGFQMQ